MHRLFFLIVFAGCTAQAADVPFEWPENYAVTERTLYKIDDDPVFINRYYRNGRDIRNENTRDGIVILRQDDHKKITIKKGKVQETMLPAGWPVSSVFPKGRPWQLQGRDLMNGHVARRYKITRDAGTTDLTQQASYVIVWLTEDGSTPLRMEDGDIVTEFTGYKPGRQDAKLFEAPVKP